MKQILQVKASEIVPSSAYTANFTLRFPRVQKFRPNLMWSDCLNLDQLTDLRKVRQIQDFECAKFYYTNLFCRCRQESWQNT